MLPTSPTTALRSYKSDGWELVVHCWRSRQANPATFNASQYIGPPLRSLSSRRRSEDYLKRRGTWHVSPGATVGRPDPIEKLHYLTTVSCALPAILSFQPPQNDGRWMTSERWKNTAHSRHETYRISHLAALGSTERKKKVDSRRRRRPPFHRTLFLMNKDS